MFMLYAIVIGVFVGLLLGGKVGRLADLQLAWIPLAVAAMLVQTVLFTESVWNAVGDLVPLVYIGSMVVVLAVVLRNLRTARALAIVAVGTAANLAAIIANGGYMPVTAEALGIAEPTATHYGGNTVLTADPALPLLVDRFALPAWLPFATIYSVGDVLIGIGLVIVVVVGMRAAPSPHDTSPTPSPSVRPMTGSDAPVP
jgi:hypothetical protein